MNIKLLQIRESTGEQVTSPEQIVALMDKEAKADRECIWCLHLNTQYEIIEKELVAMGVLNSSVIHPREVFKKAIINSAYRIIIIHNHPGGRANPSPEDVQVMNQLKECGIILDIQMDDFIILTPSLKYWSAKEAQRL